MKLVELSRHISIYDAEIAKGKLQSQGIEAILFDTGMNIMESAAIAIPVRLMVFEEDLESAQVLMAEAPLENDTPLPDHDEN